MAQTRTARIFAVAAGEGRARMNVGGAWVAAWRPEVMLLAVLLAGSYFALLSALVRERVGWPRRAAFLLALLVLYAAEGPLALWAQQRFFVAYAADMLLLAFVVPWLVIAGVPAALVERAAAVHWIARLVRFATRPVVALVLFNALVTAALLPPVLDWNLTLNWFHAILQNLLMLAALCFWAPIVGRSGPAGRMGRGMQMFYIVYSSNFMMPIIVWLFMGDPWYPVFIHAAAADGASAAEDQQAGGALMLLAMYLTYGYLAVRLFRRSDESVWYE